MRILCWNSNDDVWTHWNQVIDSHIELVRCKELTHVHQTLQEDKDHFQYLFVHLEDKTFSRQVEDVVDLRMNHSVQKMIVFPNQSSQQAALRLFSVGVNGQCAPYIGREQLSLVLSVVESGEIWGGKSFIQQLISQSSVMALPNSNHELDELSEREQNVAQWIAKGLSNKQIASEMVITERTVKAHLTSIFKKTNTKDRLALALLVQTQL